MYLILFLASAVKSLSQDKLFEISYLSSGKWEKVDKWGMVFSTALTEDLMKSHAA